MKSRKPSKATKRKALPLAEPRKVPTPNTSSDNFPIVVMGGGVGSLNAFTQVLAHLPAHPRMAFLFTSTAERPLKHNLLRFLENASVLPVVEVRERTLVEPDRIYIPAQDRVLELVNGGKYIEASEGPGANTKQLWLDPMFRAAGQQAKHRAIGVLLSGKGSDGILGMRELKAEGGLTFLQEPSTAVQSELLSKAMASEVLDAALAPRQLAEELLRLSEISVAALPDEEGAITTGEQGQYNRIFTLVRALTGVDFSFYKPSTLKRRIRRRMVLHRMNALEDYVRLLQSHPGEVDRLFQDILINVTAFFRDAEVFQALRKRVFPQLLRARGPDTPIRIWVPGCSTGEEVYSIAITLIEMLRRNSHTTPVQIFATDVSDAALAKARTGIYPESIAADVSADRLRRFFQRTDGGYQISKSVRDLCVFARQNLFEDPPFSKLDLISCRNVLIYLGPLLQKKIIPIFHYALKPSGFLLLGGSETIGLYSELFTLADRRNKVYRKAPGSVRQEVEFSLHNNRAEQSGAGVGQGAVSRASDRHGTPDVSRQVDRILLSQFAPPAVVINSQLEVLQFRGQTGSFLEHAPGEASLSILKMVKEPLVMELRPLISRALKMDVVIRKEGIGFRDGKHQRLVTVEVIPFKNPAAKDRFLLILFSEAPLTPTQEQAARKISRKQAASSAEREALRMREELLSTKESLQAIIEEQEATNEELKSANEEIQSSNEELQSTNEELETAKEELQSTNEELTTLNEELQTRNLELSQANNDLNNLLSSVNLPILMLGNDLTIRRFTPLAEKIFNLIPGDVGRKISDININIGISEMDKRVLEVIQTLRVQEHEVQDRQGRWHSLRIQPYRTSDHKIDGAVLVLVDINEIKLGFNEVTQLIKQPLLILSGDFHVQRANLAFHHAFGPVPNIEGASIYEMANGEWNIPPLKALLESVLPEKKRAEHFLIEYQFPTLGKRTLNFCARVVQQESRGTQLILLAIEDLTGKK